MKKTFKEKLLGFLTANKIDDDFFEELIDILIEGDIAAKTAYIISEELEKKAKKEKIYDKTELIQALKEILSSYILEVKLEPDPEKLTVFLVLGVNGVGKTSTIAKLAHHFKSEMNLESVLAAGDTFRAAAIEQLVYHGEKVGMRVVHQKAGSDPGAVIYDAIESVKAKGKGLVLADTAGRLHNKENLVKELQKINRLAEDKASEGAYKKILILDATTGQNALRQAEVFHEAIGIDFVILTKYDSSAKGGVVISLGKDLGLPLAFITNGERYTDIEPFAKSQFLDEFIGS